jgi:hypothetical protein
MKKPPAHTLRRRELRSALQRIRDVIHRVASETERTRPSPTALDLIEKDAEDLVIYAASVRDLTLSYTSAQRARQEDES